MYQPSRQLSQMHTTNYRVAQKRKPLWLLVIKSHLNPPSWLDFSPISITKWAQEYIKSVLNILCVT